MCKLKKDDNHDCDSKVKSNSFLNYKTPILWSKVGNIVLLHLLILFAGPALIVSKNATVIFGYLLQLVTVLGVQVGSHRYWAHRTFKANFALRLLMVVCHTISLQKDIYDWCRDHRFEMFKVLFFNLV